MKCSVLFLIACAVLNKASTEDTSPVTIVIQRSNAPNTRWDQLIPALKMMKNTTNIKKEGLHNIIKTIKHILTNETGNAPFDSEEKITAQLLKEKINASLNVLSKDLANKNDSTVISKEDINVKLNAIKEIIDSKYNMIDKDEIIKDMSVNKTKMLSNALNKMAAAISKVEENNSSNVSSETVKIFTPNPNDRTFDDRAVSNSKANSNLKATEFTIPCQRASDILEETANFGVPEKAICDLGNMDFVRQNLKSILDKLPPGQIVPNSVRCSDTGEVVAMLFKPKTISLMQVYENLLRKVFVTVLVPYHMSKLAN